MITINHNYRTNTTVSSDLKYRSPSGIVSHLSWKQLLPYLQDAFNIRAYELLREINITNDGITAGFDTKEESE
jgi:hypothetical protein